MCRCDERELSSISFSARQVKYGSLEKNVTSGVALERLGTELPDMEVEAWTVNNLPYAPKYVTGILTTVCYR